MADGLRNNKRVLTFTEHLEELRVRIIICIVVFVIFFIAGFFVSHYALGILIAPLTHIDDSRPAENLTLKVAPDGTVRVTSPSLADLFSTSPASVKKIGSLATDRIVIELASQSKTISIGSKPRNTLYFLSPLEPFFLLIKGALLLSAFFVIPVMIHQLWLFIGPGMTRRERRAIRPIIFSSFLLFPMGALFAYWMAHLALKVLIGFSDSIPGLQPNIVASEYIGFMLKLMIVFGVIFEFPLALVLLSRMGIIDSAFLVKRRRYALLLISVLAALFTPPDPFSMVASIIPLMILYEISIWVIRAWETNNPADTDTTLPKVIDEQ